MIGLTGKLVTEIRDYPPVAAITSRVRGGELAGSDAPPAVVIVKAGTSRQPFGAGSGRLALQELIVFARCYGATRIQAEQLAGAVSDAVHARGPRIDAQGRLIHLSMDEGNGGADTDPDTHWPLEVLTIRAVGGAYVVGGGPVGGIGTVAPSGGSDAYFVYTQSPAATVWTIVHGLNKHPAVTTVDLADGQIYGDVDYLSDNALTITFTGAVDGRAYLS